MCKENKITFSNLNNKIDIAFYHQVISRHA